MMHFLECRYLEGGRKFPLYDCYGIVIAVREYMGLSPLPAYSDIRKGPGMDEAVAAEIPNYQPCSPQSGAIAVCWHGPMARHIGIVVELDGTLRVLDINPRKNVTVSTLPVFERRFRRVEYYT